MITDRMTTLSVDCSQGWTAKCHLLCSVRCEILMYPSGYMSSEESWGQVKMLSVCIYLIYMWLMWIYAPKWTARWTLLAFQTNQRCCKQRKTFIVRFNFISAKHLFLFPALGPTNPTSLFSSWRELLKTKYQLSFTVLQCLASKSQSRKPTWVGSHEHKVSNSHCLKSEIFWICNTGTPAMLIHFLFLMRSVQVQKNNGILSLKG